MKLLMRFFEEKARISLKILWLGIILSTIFLSQNIITFKDGYLYSSSRNTFYVYAENLQDECIQTLKLEKMLKRYEKNNEVYKDKFARKEIIDEIFKLDNKEEMKLYIQELEGIETGKEKKQMMLGLMVITMLIPLVIFVTIYFCS